MAKIELIHNAPKYNHTISAFGVVRKGRKTSRKHVIINLEENYETKPPNKLFWDSLLLLLARLFENTKTNWEDVIIDGSGKNLKMLLDNHRQRH